MGNRINIAEILRNCPKGMELDCTMLDNVVFEKIDFSSSHHPIIIRRIETNTTIHVTKYGQYSTEEDYKCIIFPKGKTTWEGFVPPCEFKDGDIITSKFNDICIFKGENVCKGTVDYYCGISPQIENKQCFDFLIKNIEKIPNSHFGFITEYRFSTEEEKQKLFKAIEEHGYKWNDENKTLEKLIKPKFKVGDRITPKDLKNKRRVIKAILDNEYNLYGGGKIPFSDQDNWELVPNKFDITTLKPFDKVLVRDNNRQEWTVSLFSRCIEPETCKYSCINGYCYAQCIPYEGNQRLLGTTDDCSEFYKNWE